MNLSTNYRLETFIIVSQAQCLSTTCPGADEIKAVCTHRNRHVLGLRVGVPCAQHVTVSSYTPTRKKYWNLVVLAVNETLPKIGLLGRSAMNNWCHDVL
jgi:hypothetical protein